MHYSANGRFIKNNLIERFNNFDSINIGDLKSEKDKSILKIQNDTNPSIILEDKNKKFIIQNYNGGLNIYNDNKDYAFFISSDRKIGIETNTPKQKLHIKDGNLLIENGKLLLKSTDGSEAKQKIHLENGHLYIKNGKLILEDEKGSVSLNAEELRGLFSVSDNVNKVKSSMSTISEALKTLKEKKLI